MQRTHGSSALAKLQPADYSEALDRLAARDLRHRPLVTYRLQFSSQFRFSDALRLMDYFSALGVSHLYSSPLFKARAGSTHGYDITDHNRLNPEIGSEEEFREWTDALRHRGMGLVLDIVPNHVGISEHNPWWQDVLANGRSSRFADYFDIDWCPLKPELENKLLLPVLGLQYGEELESGKIKLDFDTEFFVAYYDKRFPVDLRSLNVLLESAIAKLRAEFGPRKEVSEREKQRRQRWPSSKNRSVASPKAGAPRRTRTSTWAS